MSLAMRFALAGLSAAMALAVAASMSLLHAAEKPIRIVAFGDSLTAGYGLAPNEAFPAQLQRLLQARGHAVEIANAGVSGDTTSGGVSRMEWAIPEGTEAVILELGANDSLQGRPPAEARRSLDTIVTRLRQRGIEVLVAGMLAPRNLGEAYAREFDPIFPEIASKHGALLYPFFLEGVALDPKLNLPDGLHPTAAGIGRIAERIAPKVEELIARVKARRVAAPRG
jgi:acyl-CoA thioesterase-1